MPTLAQMVRSKHPGAYDDLDDATLDSLVRKKYPGAYDDIPSSVGQVSQPEGTQNRFMVNSAPMADSLKRFAGGAAEMLNPVAMAEGAYGMVTDPMKNIFAPMVVQGAKADFAESQGRGSEAVGHRVASYLPMIGPMSADIGEQMGETGDVARGLGQATGMIAGGKVLEAAPRVVPAGVRAGIGKVAETAKPIVTKVAKVVDTPAGYAAGSAAAGLAAGHGVIGAGIDAFLAYTTGKAVGRGAIARGLHALKVSMKASGASEAEISKAHSQAIELAKKMEKAATKEEKQAIIQQQRVDSIALEADLERARKMAAMDAKKDSPPSSGIPSEAFSPENLSVYPEVVAKARELLRKGAPEEAISKSLEGHKYPQGLIDRVLKEAKAPEPVPEAPKPTQVTISAPETPKEPAKATESPKKPSVEAGDDLEGALKASLDKKDVVYAPPAFPGQQGAKGATKARFEMVAERNKSPQRAVMSEIERASANVKKWVKSNTKPEKIKDRLNSIFKGKRSFSTEEVETLIKIAQENE